jgi:DNA-binding NarL/FixJ family response regulator
MLLIVDDNKNYINRVIELLNEAKNAYRVIAASNYNEAINLIAKEKPGVVLLDMNLPGKSGIEVLHYIKEEGWDCKVIMVTNHSHEGYRKLCQDAGADIFLDKSKDFGLIPDLINKISS